MIDYRYNGTVTNVVDGDTIDVEVDLGFYVTKRIRVRLIDVNTPEVYGVKKDSEEYAEGMKAREFVEQWLLKTANEVIVETVKDRQGKYGRWLGTILMRQHPSDNSLNEQLQSMGWGG